VEGFPSEFVQLATVWRRAASLAIIGELAHDFEDCSDATVGRARIEVGGFSFGETSQERERLLRGGLVACGLELGEAVEKYVYARDDLLSCPIASRFRPLPRLRPSTQQVPPGRCRSPDGLGTHSRRQNVHRQPHERP
jgi:hypothetical protein